MPFGRAPSKFQQTSIVLYFLLSTPTAVSSLLAALHKQVR